jgi:ubiquinone/menaquinone biosynthesis C-methylase UbiE
MQRDERRAYGVAMPRSVRLVDFALGIEGIALLRTLFDEDTTSTAARLDEIVRLTTDPELGKLALEFPERSTAAGYAEWSAFYDDMPNALIEGEHQAMKSLLRNVAPGRALDAACGTGRITALLASLGHDVVGMDASPEMLAVARAKHPRGDFRHGDLEALTFDDGSFDVTTCSLALAHLETLGPALGELARVTTPGGHVVISDIHPFAVLLAGQASYMGPGGSAGVIRNYVHLPGSYLGSFDAAGLRVRHCLEPLQTDDTVPLLPSFGLVPDATRQAMLGLPVAIVWDLERGPRSR